MGHVFLNLFFTGYKIINLDLGGNVDLFGYIFHMNTN